MWEGIRQNKCIIYCWASRCFLSFYFPKPRSKEWLLRYKDTRATEHESSDIWYTLRAWCLIYPCYLSSSSIRGLWTRLKRFRLLHSCSLCIHAMLLRCLTTQRTAVKHTTKYGQSKMLPTQFPKHYRLFTSGWAGCDEMEMRKRIF